MPDKNNVVGNSRAGRKAKKKRVLANIEVRGAAQNNLKGIDLDIPIGKLNVITGASGSGKSSLAFQTLYAEGQRRYVETFSPYTRQFFERMDKPRVDAIEGIPPAIAISQSNAVRTTRSTVGTITEINDYLKLLFPRLAVGRCPKTGEEIRPDTPASVLAKLRQRCGKDRAQIVTFPVPVPAASDPEEFLGFLQGQGYLRIVLFGALYRTDLPPVDPGKGDALIPPGTLDRPLPAVVDVVQDRIAPARKARMLEALEAAFRLGKGQVKCFDAETFDTLAFSSDWHCPESGITLKPPTSGLFSFNSAHGACPTCRGFGRVIGIDLQRALPDRSLSIADGVVRAFQGERGSECQDDLERCCRARGVDTDCAFRDLPEEDREWVLYGEGGDPEEDWLKSDWYGVKGFFDWLESKAYRMHVRVFLSRYRSYTDCHTCRGTRLVADALHYRIEGRRLPDLWRMPITDLVHFVAGLQAPQGDRSCELLLREIRSRLGFLQRIGLGYLDLDRPTRSLSGGELQRVNLTTCLGAALTGTLFVLDEPSIGLHPQDTGRLIEVMHALRDLGNTLVVVEHEEAIVRAADNLIEIGPGRGDAGGEVVHCGSPAALARSGGSLTADYLSGRRRIAFPEQRRKPAACLHVVGAWANNIEGLSVEIPLGVFVCVTGVSGSGKSTLVHDVLYGNLLEQRGQEASGEVVGRVEQLLGADQGSVGEIVLVDQSPLARTPRSTPAVYTGCFDHIRKLFAATPGARAAGFSASAFSFNAGEGRCQRCMGMGFEKVEMQFLSDIYVTCAECEGTRFTPELLEIELRGRTIHDVLSMTVDSAITFFEGMGERLADAAARPLRPLAEVGLGYLRLGQPMNTLSGGESQRLKLVAHLVSGGGKKGLSSAPPLLIFDEPTTGLHTDDVRVLLAAFQRLVDAGSSLIVIEHNLDVIAHADHVIDLGPGAGSEGGRVVAEGTPEEVAALDTPTGLHLRGKLAGSGVGVPTASCARVAEQAVSGYAKSAAIAIHGAREHNLKNISLSIPHDRFVVVTGLSGSGKSTLVFDLVFAEGQRRFLDSMSTYARQFIEQMERPEVDRIAGLPPTVAIEQRISRGGGKSTVGTVTEVYHFLRLLYAKVGEQYSPESGKPAARQSVTAIATRVSKLARQGRVRVLAPLVRGRKGYHTEVAAWARRQGYEQLIVDRRLVASADFTRLDRFREHSIDAVVAELGPGTRAAEIREAVGRALEVGKGTARLLDPQNRFQTLSINLSCPVTGRSFDDPEPRLFSFNSPHGWCPACRGYGKVPARGMGSLDVSRAESVLDAELEEERRSLRGGKDGVYETCPGCQGARLNEVACSVRIGGLSLPELAGLPAREARPRIRRFRFRGREARIARDILAEIDQRLSFLEEVGLGYLSLDRSADTLSGGEGQRIRLASQLGSNLRGVLYVLDEPTIGLHPRDNERLLDTLVALRDKGNSLLVVEHDEQTMQRADQVIDLGPGAGQFGGEVVAQGSFAQIMRSKASVTGCSLRSVDEHPHPWRGCRRPLPAVTARAGWLRIKGCRANNLRNIDVQLPLGRLSVITGVSGSGKSSFMRYCLLPALKGALGRGDGVSASARKASGARNSGRVSGNVLPSYASVSGVTNLAAVYEVDQSPIGKTSRSTPATYIKVFDEIRKLYAGVPEARVRGYTASRFSFNTEGGRCETCKGNGRIKLEMNFLPTTYVQCEDCGGSRYNDATLEIRYNGRTIAEVMDMTVEEAAEFFGPVRKVHRPLRLLAETGTGYLRLGQPSPTVSGGEAQRIKLVAELSRGVARSENALLRSTGSKRRTNVYLIEEPTIGLHMADVRKLTEVLHRLVDEGHTVVVIEHNTDLMREADYLLDIGPEAGADGGTVVSCGSPEKVAASKKSRTARFLR